MDENKKTITIDMEEYKELLIIKGRYEELKERQSIITVPKTVEKDSNNIISRMPNITLCGG